MSEDNKTLVTRFFAEVCNGRNLDLADELFASSHTYNDAASRETPAGPGGIKQIIGTYQDAFPDAHWAIEDMFDSPNSVVVRWTGHGTHGRDLMGIAPTGRAVAVPGIWIFRIDRGKIVESWNAYDTDDMLRQLGLSRGAN